MSARSNGSVSPDPVSPKSMRSERDRDRDRDRDREKDRGLHDERGGWRPSNEERAERHRTLKGSQSASNMRRSSRDEWNRDIAERGRRNDTQKKRPEEISFEGSGSSRKDESRLPQQRPSQVNANSNSVPSSAYSNPQIPQRSLRSHSPNVFSHPPVQQAPRFNPSFQPSNSKKLGLDDCMKDLQLQFSEPSSDEEDDTVFRTFAEDRRQSGLPRMNGDHHSRTRDARNGVVRQVEEEEESRQERRSRITRSRSEPIRQPPSAFSSSLLTSHHLQQQQEEQSVPSARSKCTTCRSLLSHNQRMTSGDGAQVFCKPCYEERFLPKCRKCSKAITGGSVASSDGKVSGKVSRLFVLFCFVCVDLTRLPR